jgi:hypothetical protein
MVLGMGVMRLGIALGFFQGVVAVVRRQKPCILVSGNMLVDTLMHMGAPVIKSRAPEGAHEHWECTNRMGPECPLFANIAAPGASPDIPFQ